jgi:two-component system, NarL family, sensor kinase
MVVATGDLAWPLTSPWRYGRVAVIRLVGDLGPTTSAPPPVRPYAVPVSAPRLDAPVSTAGAVARFVAAGLIAAAAISAGAYWVVTRNAVAEAIRNAQEIAAIDGRAIAAPALSDAVVAGDPPALAGFDTLVRQRVLSSRVVRVKIWTTGGVIVYADVPALIGQRFGLGPQEQSAIRNTRIAAEVSELDRPENRYERGYGRLLEVYLPIESQTGQTYLFETYQVYSSIDQDQQRIWAAFFPVLLGGLMLLFVVQVPLAWNLARSLQKARREREALLSRSLEISATERRRIARDLHDGVVQALAGVAFSLGAASGQAAKEGQRAVADTITESAGVIRQAVRDLRTLIVDIAPPDLAGSRLEGAVGDLLAPLADRGIETSLKANGLESIDRDTAAVLYRAAHEAIRNAAAHAQATHLDVAIVGDGEYAELEIRDDGTGFTAEEVIGRRRHGHVGIAMLKSLVEDAGGKIWLSSRPGSGTVIKVQLGPARAE